MSTLTFHAIGMPHNGAIGSVRATDNDGGARVVAQIQLVDAANPTVNLWVGGLWDRPLASVTNLADLGQHLHDLGAQHGANGFMLGGNGGLADFFRFAGADWQDFAASDNAQVFGS